MNHNSIFLHFIAVDDFKQPPGKDIGKELLTKAFEKLTDVDYIFLVVPESARLSETLTKLLKNFLRQKKLHGSFLILALNLLEKSGFPLN